VKAPFPWFGGKRRVADRVWAALGDVDNYVEPFAGSLAVLLARPTWHAKRAETVNDADHFLANAWRAIAAAPDEVAYWCDWPVNESDLFARHLWLVNEGRNRIAAMEADPEFYDAKVAGWWVWGINAWIGSGWCSGTGPWTYDEASKLPHLGDAGQGVNRQLPHLGDAGQGVNRQLPHLGDAGQDFAPLPDLPAIYNYLRSLSERLRKVRVCCGDWSRVVTSGALHYGARKGVLLDPPYLGDVRTSDLYATDDHTIAHEVREWAIANGDNPSLRIALCGYDGQHDMPPTWRVVEWKAAGGYSSTAAEDTQGKTNRHRERVWFSPHCLDASASKVTDGLQKPDLFERGDK